MRLHGQRAEQSWSVPGGRKLKAARQHDASEPNRIFGKQSHATY
jgi:hypothetical protein